MKTIHRYTAPLGHGLLKSRLRSTESSRPDGRAKVPYLESPGMGSR